MGTRTAVVTGPTRGLGLECVRSLAAVPGWHIVLASRDEAGGDRAADEVRGAHSQASLKVVPLDVSSLASVRAFPVRLAAAGTTRLDALVCNAGVQVTHGPRLTADGYETTFATNHLGHFLLVDRLLDRLAPGARIVVVSSGTHNPEWKTGMPAPRWRTFEALARPGDPEREEWARSPGAAGRRAYSTSKLCNLFFVYELGRRLRARGRGDVTANAYDPGLMPGTGLAREYNALGRFAWRFVLPLLTMLPGASTARRSGGELARLVHDPAYAGRSGLYVQIARERRSSKQSYDEALGVELWRTSEALVGFDPRASARA
jgi:NAD(P)-dependent dehydrogenase (short-subunit alcohol dehydrogenase family)